MITDTLQAELEKHYAYNGDNSVRYTHRLRIDQIRKLIAELSLRHGAPSSQPKALDAGCAHGVYSILLAEAGYDVCGIDINHDEIETAREWAREKGLQNRITSEVGDVQNVRSQNSAFNLVVCSEVLEHIDEPYRGIRELYRVLKPGGSAIISMPNMGSLFGALQWGYRKSGIRGALGKPPLDTFQLQHSKYWFGNIMRLLTNNGFVIDRTFSSSHVPYAWEVDALLEGVTQATYSFERAIGSLPVLRYIGFNFIVLARKPDGGPDATGSPAAGGRS